MTEATRILSPGSVQADWRELESFLIRCRTWGMEYSYDHLHGCVVMLPVLSLLHAILIFYLWQ